MNSAPVLDDLPELRDEAWRYTPLAEVVARLRLAAPARASDAVTSALVDELAGDHGGVRVVLVNGIHVPSLSDLGPVAGATVRAGRTMPGAHAPADGFDARNLADGHDTAHVRVDAGADLAELVHVVHVAVPGDEPTASHPRTHIELGTGARAVVLETFAGVPGRVITNATTTIELGSDAELVHHRIQLEADEAVHIGRTRVAQGRSSTLRSTSASIGAEIARHSLDVLLAAPDAVADLGGVYAPSGRQRHDTAVTVDHAASGCRSDQRFRGVIDDAARGSFSGHVIVRPGTVGSDARQSNRNLVLTRQAQADSRPWLEIFADDVRCSHGSTVGRLDDDALFYLRSRGIPADEARAMLVEAFANEVLATLAPPSLRDHVVARVAGARR